MLLIILSTVLIILKDKHKSEVQIQIIVMIIVDHLVERGFFHTYYNQYLGENIRMFDGYDFWVELTQHIPPKWGIYTGA